MNDYYNLLNGVCPPPAGNKVKTIAYYDESGYPIYAENSFIPGTQKAKSIINGIRLFEKIDMNKYVPLRDAYGANVVSPKMLELIQHKKDIELLPSKFWTVKYPVFARPCPLTPRHGFVDSRVISTKKQLQDLLVEVKAADTKGEIVLSPFVEADYNSILCSNGFLSVGPGHDGATSGHDSVCFPVAPAKISTTVRFASGLSSKSTIFIEAVYKKTNKRTRDVYDTKQSFFVTQLRGGPKVDAVNDFIPSKLTVKKVIVPCDDLLKWESVVKKLSPGTVVYGKGHTLTSHAAIHCVINKIPFITSFEPRVGQSIAPSTNNTNKFDKQSFLLGVTAGLYSTLSKRKMLHFSATILHNWVYLSGSEHGSWLLGLASVYISKILCALSYGEYRHCQSKPLKIKGVKNSCSRSSIYSTVMDAANFDLYIKNAFKIKKEFPMKTKFRRGFGGKLWADAVKHSINIWNLIADIQNAKKASPAKTKALVAEINKSINLVHNNGWLFNKISESSSMEKIAKSPSLAALELGDVFYEEYLRVKSLKKPKKILRVKAI